MLSIYSLKSGFDKPKNGKKGADDKKKNNIHVYILEQNQKSGCIRIKLMLLAVIVPRVQFYQSQHICDVINYINVNFDFVASK